MFTYGQTGSGKTHSILGSSEDPGITIRCIVDIFSHIRQHPDISFSLKVSYMEVYNEEINDLLHVSDEADGHGGKNLRIIQVRWFDGVVVGLYPRLSL